MGNFSQETLDTTFNQVLGMVLDLPKHQLEEAKVYFQSQGINALLTDYLLLNFALA